MAEFRSWAWLFTSFVILLAVTAHQSRHHHHDNPIGINLGPDYITAVVSLDGAETQLIVQKEGDIQYKSLMRQKILHQRVVTDLYETYSDETSSSHNAISNDDKTNITSYLHRMYGTPATARELRTAFTRLKSDISIALKRDVRYVVVGVPGHLSEKTRKLLRKQLNEAGFSVLNISRRPALVASEQGYDVGIESFIEHIVLFVEISRAAFEVSLLSIHCDTVDPLQYEARLEFGEDILALKAIESMTFEKHLDSLDATAVMDLKLQLQRSWEQHEKGPLRESMISSLNLASFKPGQLYLSLPNATSLGTIAHERSKAIQSSLEDFLIRHTRKSDSHDDSEWKPLRSEVTEVLISGDASRRDLLMLKQVVSNSRILSRLRQLKNVVPSVQTGAHGAARNGQRRVEVDEPGGEPRYIYHYVDRDEL